MGTSCAAAPSNKKEYIADIGKILVEENGKKKYYKPVEVKEAHKKSKGCTGIDFSCWAMCMFSSHEDFDSYHETTGETCDYSSMKTKMLGGISNTESMDFTNLADSDIDASWLDFGDIFDGFIEGIGEFIGSIFEGL